MIKLDQIFCNMKNELRIIFFYRYFSLILTSSFYLFKGGISNNTIIVVLGLSVAAIILNHIYINSYEETNLLKIAITIETIGNLVILIPTGGLNSPYIWYSLNTVLISSYFLDLPFFLFNLLSYTTILTTMSFFIFDNHQLGFLEFLTENSNLILSYILIILAIQLLSEFLKKIKEESHELKIAYDDLAETNKVKKELLIAEEQNRIAGEIHDSVCQQLFHITCKLQALVVNKNISANEYIKNELNIIKDYLIKASKDLRNTIYSIGKNSDESVFLDRNISKIVNEIKNLNGVNIVFETNKENIMVSDDVEKALIRILNEGIGNAVRHGKSKNIKIILMVDNRHLILHIKDDGCGFDVENKISLKNDGLGLKNIHKIVKNYGGEIKIESIMNKGTKICVKLPNMIT
jgi:signal transduction histidine kinase